MLELTDYEGWITEKIDFVFHLSVFQYLIIVAEALQLYFVDCVGLLIVF